MKPHDGLSVRDASASASALRFAAERAWRIHREPTPPTERWPPCAADGKFRMLSTKSDATEGNAAAGGAPSTIGMASAVCWFPP